MAATWGDGDERAAGTVSVADLCRRLGAPTASAGTTGTNPVLVGDLLRREGHAVPAPPPADTAPPARDTAPKRADAPGIPIPRRRTADACRAALGAGGLVVAGSVLGAALLAAAGVGGPIFAGQAGDDGSGPIFGGDASLGTGGIARGTVTGRQVVWASGLLNRAYESFAAPPATPVRRLAAVPRTAQPTVPAPRSAAAAVPAAGGTAAAPAAGTAAGGAAGPQAGAVTGTVAGAASTVKRAGGPVAAAVAPVAAAVAPVAAALDPVTDGVVDAAGPAMAVLSPLTSPVLAATESVTGRLGLPGPKHSAAPTTDLPAPVAGLVNTVVPHTADAPASPAPSVARPNLPLDPPTLRFLAVPPAPKVDDAHTPVLPDGSSDIGSTVKTVTSALSNTEDDTAPIPVVHSVEGRSSADKAATSRADRADDSNDRQDRDDDSTTTTRPSADAASGSVVKTATDAVAGLGPIAGLGRG